jgi:alpha-tubulin suppressor-like RCC1 family protein
LSFGNQFCVGITDDGGVFTWGNNEFGQCGYTDVDEDQDDGTDTQYRPKRIEMLAKLGQRATFAACGERHASIVTQAGRVFSWGSGETHQIGILDNEDQFNPVWVQSIVDPVVSLSVGWAVTAAATQLGDTWMWGWAVETAVPKLMDETRSVFVTDVQCGENDNICVMTGQAQEYFKWEFDEDDEPKRYELLRGKRFDALSVGSAHRGGVTASGKVWLWGRNNDFQLGTGDDVDMYLPFQVPLKLRMAHVVCGAVHSVALSTTGVVLTWGNGAMGRLGHGLDGDELKPRIVQKLAAAQHKVVKIAAGHFNTACVTDKGLLFVWGAGGKGQIPASKLEPQMSPLLVTVLDEKKAPLKWENVAYGRTHCVALDASGVCYTWGDNSFGQLGYPTNGELQKEPKSLVLLKATRVVEVACSDSVSFFLSDKGRVFACGSGETNQLGAEDMEDQPYPMMIERLRNVKVTHIETGNLNCAALTETDIWVWGWAVGATPRKLDKLDTAAPIRFVSVGLSEMFFSS